MNRSKTQYMISNDCLATYKYKIAYHEAGHAAAIHSSNRQKHLPTVYFQIIFKDVEQWQKDAIAMGEMEYTHSLARINGGRLIQTFPQQWRQMPLDITKGITDQPYQFTDDYRLAFEADILNLLIGPLAEARYVLHRDNEPFHHQLFTAHALTYYGGDADLAVVNDYLQCYTANKLEQDRILSQFLVRAFNFVNENSHWKAISRLAHHILAD